MNITESVSSWVQRYAKSIKHVLHKLADYIPISQKVLKKRKNAYHYQIILRIFATDMRNILKVDTPNDYARFVDAPLLHPLISIIHYDELAPFRHSLNNYGVYGLFIQRQFTIIFPMECENCRSATAPSSLWNRDR